MGWKRWIGSGAMWASVTIGCGDDDPASSGSASAEGDSSDTEPDADTDPSEGEPTTESDEGVDSGDSGDSTGGELTDDTRVIYEVRSDGGSELEVIDVIDGVASDPVSFHTLDERDHFSDLVGDRWLFVTQQEPFSGVAFDLTTPPPFTSWSLDAQLPNALGYLSAHDAAGSGWVLSSSDGVALDLYALDMTDAGPTPPRHVGGELPKTSTTNESVFVRDDSQVAFTSRDLPAQTSTLWLTTVETAGAPTQIVAQIDLPREIYRPVVAQNGNVLVYTEGQGIADQIVRVVDLSNGGISDAIAVDVVGAATANHGVRFAPDGSGFVVMRAANDISGENGDFMWVALDGGAPLPSVALTTGALAGQGSRFAGWSSDARWAAFTTDASTHVAPIDAGTPEPSVMLASNANTDVAFAPDAGHVYFVGTTEEGASVVQRAVLDGDAPGSPDSLSSPCVSVEQLALAQDGSALLYIAVAQGETSAHAYWVDLSAAEPLAPVRLDGSDDPSAAPTSAEISAAGSHVLYRGEGVVLVDTATAVETVLADGGDVGETLLLQVP
jgi:hypothetical protein